MEPDEKTLKAQRKAKKPAPAPTISAKGAAKILGFTSTESVQKLARQGPEHGGIAAYVLNEDGIGFRRKYGTGAEYSGIESFFFQEDLERWLAKHPIPSGLEERARVEYSEQEKQLVLGLAQPEYDEKGYVTRTRIQKILHEEHHYSVRFYKKMKQILDDMDYPYPPGMRNTSLRRHKKNK